jgi:hypothetical protein
LKRIAGKIGKHENLRGLVKGQQGADSIGKVDRRGGRSQAGKTQKE